MTSCTRGIVALSDDLKLRDFMTIPTTSTSPVIQIAAPDGLSSPVSNNTSFAIDTSFKT